MEVIIEVPEWLDEYLFTLKTTDHVNVYEINTAMTQLHTLLRKQGIHSINYLTQTAIRDNLETFNTHVLFIKYNTLLEGWMCRTVINHLNQTDGLLFLRPRLTYFDEPEQLCHIGDQLVQNERRDDPRCIRSVFHGAALVSSKLLRAFKTRWESVPEDSWLDLIASLSTSYDIKVINVAHPAKYRRGAGSYASSRPIKRFRKEAFEKGQRKLRDEIRFLKNLPKALRPIYPQLLDDHETTSGVFLELEYIDHPSLRDLIFHGKLDAAGAFNIIRNVLTELFDVAYSRDTVKPPSNYLDQYYFLRVWDRLHETLSLAPLFGPVIQADQIVLNGRRYWNIPCCIAFMESDVALRKRMRPQAITPYAHGDLHFANILAEPQGNHFRLVDPRGYPSCDLFYDLGKLSHSTHGLYDLLHENRYQLYWEVNDNVVTATLNFTPSAILDCYKTLDTMLAGLYELLTEDPICSERVLFAEAMHFCSDMPFHLRYDQYETLSMAIYLTGVQLINDYVEQYCKPLDGFVYTELGHQALRHNKHLLWKNKG